MSNVFQPVTQPQGVQVGQTSQPIAPPSARPPRDRGGEILDVMRGAAELASVFAAERSAEQQAEAQAAEDRALAAFQLDLSDVEAERDLFIRQQDEASMQILRGVTDNREINLESFQSELDEIREADTAGLLDPYKFRSLVDRKTADFIARNPHLRDDINSIRDTFVGRLEPSREVTNAAEQLQHEHMSQRYGSNWTAHDAYIESKRMVQQESIDDLKNQLEEVEGRQSLAKFDGNTIGRRIERAVGETAGAELTDLVSRWSEIYQEQGFLTEDQIIQYRDEESGIFRSLNQDINSLIGEAESGGSIIPDDRVDRIRNTVRDVFEDFSMEGLSDREMGERFTNIRELEQQWIEHNVPQLPMLEVLASAGGDRALSHLVAINRMMQPGGAMVDRVEGLLDDATTQGAGAIEQTVWDVARMIEHRNVFRDQVLGEGQRRLYDTMTLSLGANEELDDHQKNDMGEAVIDAISSVDESDFTPETMRNTNRYLFDPQVIDNIPPEQAKRALANMGRKLIGRAWMMGISLDEEGGVEFARQVGATPTDSMTTMLHSLRQAYGAKELQDFLDGLDKYADRGVGEGREEFFQMVEDEFSRREEQREAGEQARVEAFRGRREEESRDLSGALLGAANAPIRAEIRRIASAASDGSMDEDQVNRLRTLLEREPLLRNVQDVDGLDEAIQMLENSTTLTEEELTLEPTSHMMVPDINQEVIERLRRGQRLEDIISELGVG